MKTQAEIDAEFNTWFEKSFKGFLAPHIKAINRALGIHRREIIEIAKCIAGEEEKGTDGKIELPPVGKIITKLTGQITELQTTVTKLQQEISTLRAALGKDVMTCGAGRG